MISRQRQPVRAATAVAGGHEHRGRFAPDTNLALPVQLHAVVERLQYAADRGVGFHHEVKDVAVLAD